MAKPIITAAQLRERFSYDPETGLFTRLVRVGITHQAGVISGSNAKGGYERQRMNGATYASHRLAWLYVTGEWPKGDIDHIDGNRKNNRFSNLRDVSRSTNIQNLRNAKGNSKSGLLGAFLRGDGRWFSRINVRGVIHRLGFFESAEEAHAAYIAAKRQLHEGCTI